jgi:hypothetical protein
LVHIEPQQLDGKKMTSQVAVANHSGVAVASDTVTTAYVEGGTKTIGNSHKIWEIGREHRVLVLHSGAVTQNGVIVKLLVSEWAATLGEPLENLEGYVDSYIAWMSREKSIHTEESEIRRANFLLNDHYYEIKKRSQAKWNSIPVDEEQYTSREEILTDIATQGLGYLQSLEMNVGVSGDSDFTSVLEHVDIDLSEKIQVILENLGLNPVNTQILLDSAPLILSRSQDFPGSSTLAFVGYGKNNYFPSNMRLNSRGFYGGRFIHEKGELYSIHPEGGSGITAFAQDEAIFGFVRGLRWEVLNYMTSTIEQKVNEALESEVGENLGESIAGEVNELVRDFYYRRFTQPLLDSIEGLDIGHLANLAESLVGMEATSAFGGDGPATVGGLIEVATIDRQRGVVWVKSL